MAGRCSSKLDMGVQVLAAAVALVVMLGAVVDGTRPVKRVASSGKSTTEAYVYPYWSVTKVPAVLLDEEYQLVSVAKLGGLEPEYDETNDTYYMRFTDDSSNLGAKYVMQAETESNDVQAVQPLRVNSTVYIINAESKRALQWREEGSDGYFLIEAEESGSAGALFRFTEAEGVSLPCPLVFSAECHAYYLLSDPASSSSSSKDAGLLAYAEDGVTYVKAAATGSEGDLPLLLIKVDTTSSRSTSLVAAL